MTNSNEISATQQQRILENANRAKNPLDALIAVGHDLHHFVSPQAEKYTIFCRHKSDMDAKLLKWAFKLAERNVSSFYKELSMGWQPKVKQTDMKKNWARYLVAQNEQQQPVAFAMFRFDLDQGFSVLYCYELQIEEANRRQGLGRFLLRALELCARHYQMEKIVLTVLRNNKDAYAFFTSMDFQVDSSSPEPHQNADYMILSKDLTNE